MNTSNQIQKDHNKLKSVLKDGYEKLMSKYSMIESSLKALSSTLSDKNKEEASKILKDLQTFKDSFKSYVSKISQNVNTLMQHSELSSTTSDQSKELVISPRIKNSYDQISSEFTKLEKITKEVLECKSQIKAKQKKRILLLEQQLQTYCNNISNIDFNNIQKEMDSFNLGNKDKICNYISSNNKINESLIIDYSVKDSTLNSHEKDENKGEEEEAEYGDSSYNNNEGSYFSEYVDYSQEGNNSIINKIVEGNPTKEEDMIDLIESILEKSHQSTNSKISKAKSEKNSKTERSNKESKSFQK
ncbi:MAG: hypothetical protein MJ252_23590 [archaeon]|nr:hypothetical protein [archaeon]